MSYFLSRAPRFFALRPSSRIALVSLCFFALNPLVACVSRPSETDSTSPGAASGRSSTSASPGRSGGSGSAEGASSVALSADAKNLSQEFKLIEMAFAKRNCQQVNDHGRALGQGSRASKERNTPWPVSVQVALAVCEAELNPKDKDRQKLALSALDMAQKNLVPVWDLSLVETLRTERHLALGEKDKALKAKRRAREHLLSLDKNIAQLDAEILELSDGLAGLNEEQKARFKDAVFLASKDDKLWDAIRVVDELLSQVNHPEARQVLINRRSQMHSRLEELFSLEAAQLETKRNTGTREAEAREQAQEMRKRFPPRHFQVRIDSIMGVAAGTESAMGGGITVEGQAPANVTGIGNGAGSQPATGGALPSGGTPPSNVAGSSGDAAAAAAGLSAEKALQDARAALDSGNAERAVEVLDSLPDSERNDRTRRLRREAMDVHVRDLRLRVRELYNRATAQTDKQVKLDALRQCKQILEKILQKYPDHSGRSGIERNLKTINQDIEEIGKGK